MLAGIVTIAREPTLRTLVGLYAAQTLVAGALNVLVVVTAFELLDLQAAGVGLLYAAIGVGGLIGGFVALVLSAAGGSHATSRSVLRSSGCRWRWSAAPPSPCSRSSRSACSASATRSST